MVAAAARPARRITQTQVAHHCLCTCWFCSFDHNVSVIFQKNLNHFDAAKPVCVCVCLWNKSMCTARDCDTALHTLSCSEVLTGTAPHPTQPH